MIISLLVEVYTMIVTKPKKIEEILEYLKNSRSVSIIGCGACAAACQSGGKDDVEKMSGILEENYNIKAKTVVDEACHHMLTKRQLRDLWKDIEESDSILVMACGAGVQCVAELFEKSKVFPANDTHMLGNAVRTGQFKGYCSMCGDCILGETEAICVKTRCPKNHLNGPCGGMHNGKCEVFVDEECVFVTIYKRKKNKLNEKVLKNDFSKRIRELKLPRKKI